MGSFAYTCGISNLPISAGDKVRYILISSNPYEDNLKCSINSEWFPRTFPLKAEYNDYGSIENVKAGVARDLWQDGFKLDLISVGTGDNQIHDTPTSKDMSWEELLVSVRQGRLKVSSDVHTNPWISKLSPKLKKVWYPPKPKTPVGIPTIQRVTKAIKEANIKGALIDKIKYGLIRIRISLYDYENQDKLFAKCQKALPEYVTMVRAGSGAYAHSAELLVGVKPGTKGFYNRSFSKNKSLKVNHIMIREDVWRGLCELPVTNWHTLKPITVKEHRQAVRSLYKKYVNDLVKPVNDDIQMVWLFLTKDEIPFTVGLASNWKLLINKQLPIRQVSHILDGIGEMIHIIHHMSSVRWMWKPSYSTGPQFGEWGKHKEVLELFSKIAASNLENEILDEDT